MSWTDEETKAQASPAPHPPRRDDHLFLWVGLMLCVLAACIWWLLSQSWTGATSNVTDRVVVVPAHTATAPESRDLMPKPETGASAGKPETVRKSVAPARNTALRTREPRTANRRTRNAHPLADNPPPRYPTSALRSGIEGTVLVRAEIDADGTPVDVGIARRSGNRELDRAALNAVRGWRFQPALRDGKAVASAVQVPVDFVLEDR